MLPITVEVLIADKRLQVGRYDDATIADAVAQSWARWSGCRAAIIAPAGCPPIVVVKPSNLVAFPTAAPLPPAA